MRKTLVFIFTFILLGSLKAQELSNFRISSFQHLTDTIQLDSLSIIPNSEIIFNKNNLMVSDSLYSIDYANAQIFPSKSLITENTGLTIKYRVFPIKLSDPLYSRKKEETVILGPVLTKASTKITKNQKSLFSDNQLNKRGSISRGISIGNNQDAVINSNLNLQLSGKISKELNIIAAISDENIPVQPDGNSQQIQEFDKVFIQLYNKKTKLIAGDFEIFKPKGYFMNLNKKAQGGLLNTSIDSKKNKANRLETTVSAAVSKGKYCRKTFQGQEGNQGPYKLTGCENEQFIVVIAGTERIYIDGKLKTRGKEHDYIIDYNTSEITFTANQPITKDSRIVIEFEYTERSYARFMIYTSNLFKTKNSTYWLNIYSEQDSKNQPINQDLSQEQKQLLSLVGDSIQNAYVPNIDSVEFNSDYVLYAKQDTLVNGVNYEIYNYSTNPAEAKFQVGFNLVGNNKGNYIQIQSSANGKVFEWVAPVAGIPQGEYEPVRLLISPKKQQMLSFGGELNLNSSTQTNFELAISNYDINTFSNKDADNNVGYALNLGVSKSLFRSDTVKNKFIADIQYQLINQNFTSIERFRTVEFERDWNIENTFFNDEHLAKLGLKYRHKTNLYSNYEINFLTDNDIYSGYRQILNTNYFKSGYSININSSLLNTDSENNTTEFIRYIINLSKTFKKLEIGVENELEQNTWKNNQTDSILNNSFSFSSYRIFIENPDSSINQYSLSYKLRNDQLPRNNNLNKATRSEDFQFGFGLLKNPSSLLKTKITYRKLEVQDTTISQEKEENTLTGRIDYNLRLFKGAITSLTFYEAGSGLEPKREYSFLKVASGQGAYAWEDYNDNGIAELDEFELAQFQDQANYIRIFSFGNEYLKTYKNEFSQAINIRPEAIWRSQKGIKKLISRFSNSLAYQINQKSTDEILEHSLNPFYNSTDSTIINLNQSIRNTLSFNRSKTKFGVDYIYQGNSNKILLSNGFDERKRYLHGIKLRWKFLTDFTFQNYLEIGKKIYNSEFFSAKNYTLHYNSNELKIQYQPGFKTKTELNYTYTDKRNTLSTEESTSHNIGAEINYSITKKGNLQAKANYLNISYNSDTNTSLAYEMLQGLKPGNNATWSLTFQRKLAGYIEMNIIYNGRASETIKTIHTGSIQLRAFF